jgi:hypothetical protein
MWDFVLGGSMKKRQKRWPINMRKAEAQVRDTDEYTVFEMIRIFDSTTPITQQLQRAARTWDSHSYAKGFSAFLDVAIPLGVRTLIETANRKIAAYAHAADTLKTLCEAGCDREHMLYLLGACQNLGASSSKQFAGFDSETLKRKLKLIRKAADTLKVILGHEFGILLKDGKHFRKYERLGDQLDQYSVLLEHGSKHLASKTDFYLHLSKAALQDYVQLETNAFHVKEVSELLGIVLEDENYTENEHRLWMRTRQERRATYEREPHDSWVISVKKTLLEMRAAHLYRLEAITATAPTRKQKK